MTQDRELLELAAKAAGLVVKEQRSGGLHWTVRTPVGLLIPWNPLTDDGDALRLAVKLRFEIVPVSGGCIDVCLPGSNPFAVACEGGSCPYAATRRAITRAAAEIGKAMQKDGGCDE